MCLRHEASVTGNVYLILVSTRILVVHMIDRTSTSVAENVISEPGYPLVLKYWHLVEVIGRDATQIRAK